MDIQFRSEDGLLVCTLVGQLESESAIQLNQQFTDLGEPEEDICAIEMSGVSFIDSSGIGALVYAFKQLKALGKKVVLVGASDQPAEILSFLRVDKVIRNYPSIAELRSQEKI